jgi:hypothetical protein
MQTMTPEQVHDEVINLRAEIHKDFGDFKADLIKTIWITQLSTIGIILIGIGLLIHFRL